VSKLPPKPASLAAHPPPLGYEKEDIVKSANTNEVSCSYCKDSGICSACKGKGSRWVFDGTHLEQVNRMCTSCNGSGICRFCMDHDPERKKNREE